MRVHILTIEDDGQAHDQGALVLRDGQVATEPANSAFLRSVRDEAFFVDDKELRADSEPEAFLRNLHRHYTGSRMRATKVEDDE